LLFAPWAWAYSTLHPLGVGKWVPAIAGKVQGRYVWRCLVRAMYLSASAVAVSTWGALSSARPLPLPSLGLKLALLPTYCDYRNWNVAWLIGLQMNIYAPGVCSPSSGTLPLNPARHLGKMGSPASINFGAFLIWKNSFGNKPERSNYVLLLTCQRHCVCASG